MKLKNIILSVILIATVCSCKDDDNNDDPRRKTNPGYVAFDYTISMISSYENIFSYIFKFNEYYSQTSISKRDSVDNLYFYDVKIIHDEKEDAWTLRNLNYITKLITINPNGKMIDENGTKWEVSYQAYGRDSICSFEIENKGNHIYKIAQHNVKNSEFEISSEWEIKTKDNGCDEFAISNGNGILTSIATPKLKLEYTVKNPIEFSLKEYDINGTLEIFATDMNINQTEEVNAEINSDTDVEITYKNITESWDYKFYNRKD